MTDSEKFAALQKARVEEQERRYGRESRARYGDAAVDAQKQAILQQSPAAYARQQELEQRLLETLARAVAEGEDPQGSCGEQVTGLHRAWLESMGQTCDSAMQKGIAQLYVCDARFTAYYDKKCPGCAAFLQKSVDSWAEKCGETKTEKGGMSGK